MTQFRAMLPTTLRHVFDVIMNHPNGTPKKDDIAKSLGLSSQEITRRMDRLGMYYYALA